MRETGIVRRIDELGRVVIPKEIRKTLRISEGDPLEIFTQKEELILKKYSPIGAVSCFAKDIVNVLYSQTGFSAGICDTDCFLVCKGQLLKDFERKTISEGLLKNLKNRKTLVSEKEGVKLKITDDDETIYGCQIILPIISKGDLYGGIIMVSNDEKIHEKTLALASFSVDFLSRGI